MSVKEAYKIVNEKFKDMYIYGCTEYNDIYVFNICNSKEREMLPNVRGILWSVNKKTGENKAFMPFHLSPTEYRAGKQIEHFK